MGGIKQGLNTITHPFDADGMVSAITFNYPNILLRSRYVQTEGRIADTSLGQFTSRGVFGTPRHGGWLNNIFRIGLKNVANTNAQTWGNRVLALWEGGRPYSLHPDSLQTRKPDRFDNLFNNRRPLSAHGRVDHENQRYLTYSVEIITPNRVKVHTYEISPQYEILRTRSDLLSGFGLFHDFAFTQDYFVFIQAPLSFNVLPFLFGLKVFMQ